MSETASSGLDARAVPPSGWLARVLLRPRTVAWATVAVLSAAVPRPADPALRVLEQQRAGQGSPATRTEPDLAVQLVAVARREQAVEAWTRLQRGNADLLGRLQPIIVEPERRVSTLYRLRAGPVASPREAQALCASPVRRRVDCIVVQAGG